ncbi:hypothetical protein F4860DRAFT_371234 [Xylaria cubensis]|nr:hypothetical protein F4860DRAFT_371234 [Xylaria cubensis]
MEIVVWLFSLSVIRRSNLLSPDLILILALTLVVPERFDSFLRLRSDCLGLRCHVERMVLRDCVSGTAIQVHIIHIGGVLHHSRSTICGYH